MELRTRWAGQPLNPGARESIAVVQVETVTTVQSSAGSFLSPTPEQIVPAYVERSAGIADARSPEQAERAKIDIALLFRGDASGQRQQRLDAQLVSANAAAWSAIEHCFPHVEQSAAARELAARRVERRRGRARQHRFPRMARLAGFSRARCSRQHAAD